MADESDLATELVERERAAILAARRPSTAPASTGVCGSCGDTIEPRRLAVLPTTTLCAECAHDVDRRSRP
ncbi:MAG: TraR/DksA C4-type zinc finger protein [Caenispirillum sp.]|nr:TraR/DksA C4-type zinc finger protein [Caenispirillum sp.]